MFMLAVLPDRLPKNRHVRYQFSIILFFQLIPYIIFILEYVSELLAQISAVCLPYYTRLF